MSRGSSSLGGGGGFGGFSSGHSTGSYGGSHGNHSSGGGFWTGLILGSIFSRRGGGNYSSGSDNGGNQSERGPQYKRVRNQKATIIVSAIFLALTIAFAVLAVVFRFDRVYALTTATATDYDKRYDYYYTTYDFSLNGKEYSVESKVGWTKLEHMEGKAYTEENIDTYYLHKDYKIYYKISNPYEIYEIEAKADMPSTNGLYIFLAVLFGIITVVIYAGGINKYELDPAYVEEQKRQEEAKQMEGKRKCPYCKGVMDASDNKCPNCGASMK